MSDLIYREAAIDALNKALDRETLLYRFVRKIAVDAVKALPPVDAVPVRRGRWIIYVVSPFDGEDVKCSECGAGGCASYWDYCPYCGADMREEDSDDT